MMKLEHYENITIKFTKDELMSIMACYLGLTHHWKLDDADVSHEGSEIHLTIFIQKQLDTATAVKLPPAT